MSKTWKKETDDLFDFNADEIERSEITLTSFSQKFYLVYLDEKLQFIDSYENLIEKFSEMQNNKTESLLLIVSEFIHPSPTCFKINNPILSHELRKNIANISSLCRSWRLCQKNEENLISIGDVIKLGRVRLKIDTICFGEIYESSLITTKIIKNKSKLVNNKVSFFNNNNVSINNININSILNNTNNNSLRLEENEKINESNQNNKEENFEKNKRNIIMKDDKKLIPTCRICYMTNSDIDNPLISPCKCTGSMKYIHFLCLKKCIEVNIIKKIEPNFKFYNWKNFSCEICKFEYPKYIKYKDNLYPLVDLEINYSSYVICDYTLYDDNKKKSYRKGILVFKINEDNDEEIISVGRSQNNRIKLKDISVSRYHCNFIKRKNKLFVIDKGSKFGTLIYLNNPLCINLQNTEGTLISGRHWFSVKLQQKQNFFSKFFQIKCCECSNIRNGTDVNIENLGNNQIQDNSVKNRNDNFQLIDDSYQDYVLDLGDNMYLHKESNSEEDNKSSSK